MRLLFTGATGFLGRATLPALAAAGHEVVVLSRAPRQDLDAEVVVGDVLDPATLAPALAGCEAVIHAAGKVSHAPADAAMLWRLHVQGTDNVLDAAKAAGVRRVVYISTSGTIAVSDDGKHARDESAPSPLPLIGAWPYYRSKLLAEQAALSRSCDDFAVVSLNPSLLLGPGDTLDGQSTAPVRRFLDGDVPVSPPGGLSFVDVRDVAEAIAGALHTGAGGRRYLLGSANMTFAQFYARIARITGDPAPMLTAPAFTRQLLSWMPRFKQVGNLSREELELACHFWYLDDTLARTELAWRPRDPQRTLEDTVAELQSREGIFTPWVQRQT